MNRETGNLSINTENIMPIIKKWLYSDQDIFVRELVSNASDAITKFRKLADMGEAEAADDEKYFVKVIVNADDKTISFIDNGIGMTGDEVRRYINQIAFSGAQDFIDKYKDKIDEKGQIIGHFGLGFYSAFMVSEKITIDTLSYLPGAQAVKWTSKGGTEYEMEESDRKQRGTAITLHVSQDGLEFVEEFKMRGILLKYCNFLPYEIYLEDASNEARKEKEGKKGDDSGADKPINDTHPLWLKNPKDCTDQEYKDFYRNVFLDFNDPLFWIHLNMDYPFNLKGILYFPKLRHEFETVEGQIKLYYNQIFVADNIKEVIPEFLMLLKGTIDCPDLPLNVSRSFLQNDANVAKLSAHITKKVADKLTSLYESERDNYNKYWDDINPFVKYGCMKESKFYDKVKDIVIYKLLDGSYVTLREYLDKTGDKHKDKVYYVTDQKQQAQYIRIFKEHGMEAIILPSLIDTHFIQFLEYKESGIKFSRIDSDISDSLKQKGGDDGDAKKDEADAASLESVFKEAVGDDKLVVKAENLKSTSLPAIIILSEHSRRMKDMSRFFGGMEGNAPFPEEKTLVLNSSNELIKRLVRLNGMKDRKDEVMMMCSHVYDLALMSQRQLEPDAMMRFIDRSNMILSKLAEEAEIS